MLTQYKEIKVFQEDISIAKKILLRDESTTREYYYKKCYPLFKSIYDRYVTDCESCIEFMNEIYILILTKSKKTNRCQLENFQGESTLASWLKSVCLFYCYRKYQNSKKMGEKVATKSKEDSTQADRLITFAGSIGFDFSKLERNDIDTLLAMMPNKRYSEIIRLKYVENLSNEEVAEIMGMSMANFYNKHKSAKEQYLKILRKEDNNE